MAEFVNGAKALTGIVVAVLLLAGAAWSADPEDLSRQDPRAPWTEARQGNDDAQYRLGRHFERRYWLGQRDPEVPGDPTDLALAHALFRMAENSGRLDALYGRHETEYRLKEVLGDEAFDEAMATVPEWMRAASPPPPSRQTTASAEDIALESEKPVQALKAPAANGEDGGTAANADPPPAGVPEQRVAARSERSAEPDPDLRTQSRSDVSRPNMETLLARGRSDLDAGDLVSARGFFELAAGQGSGEAAMLAGVTYDPGYLEPAGVVGVRPDAEQATAWYLKAIEMGHDEAESRLRALKERLDRRSR